MWYILKTQNISPVYLNAQLFCLVICSRKIVRFLPTSTIVALDSSSKFECIEVLLQETNFKTGPIQKPAQFIPA
jgi:hypothetical protein